MSATNGSAVPSRSGRGLIAIFMALALLASALFASSASAAKPTLKPAAYVAMGDSLGFGYTYEEFLLNYPTDSPSVFEGGYTNYVANPSVPVKLVTINMGSNDELQVVAKCSEPLYDQANGFNGLLECIGVEAGPSGHFYPGGLFKHIIVNVATTIGVLRAYGYAGPVGILGFNNPEAKLIPGSDELQKKLNEAFECAAVAKTAKCSVEPKPKEHLELPGKEELGPGVVYANPFKTFNPQNASEQEPPLGYKRQGQILIKALGL